MHPEDVKAIDAYTEIVRREAAKDAEIARLQEQAERWCDKYLAALRRAEAAEAERDRLRDAMNKPTTTMIEDGVLAYNLTGIAGGIINTAEDHVEFIWQAMSSALQKEPQP